MSVSPAAARDALAACAALGGYGRVRAQPASDWTGDVPLPDTLAAFYRDVGPDGVTAETIGNALYFPSLADLWQKQEGYRWDGRTGERVEDWDDGWIVVAHQGGAPFVFDTATRAVLFARHGEGTWDFGEAFPDLNSLAFVAGTLGRLRLERGLSSTRTSA